MSITLPITCKQLGYIILVGLFFGGNGVLIPINYDLTEVPQAFFGFVMIGLSTMFGIVALVIYIDDNKIIRCKCDKK